MRRNHQTTNLGCRRPGPVRRLGIALASPVLAMATAAHGQYCSNFSGDAFIDLTPPYYTGNWNIGHERTGSVFVPSGCHDVLYEADQGAFVGVLVGSDGSLSVANNGVLETRYLFLGHNGHGELSVNGDLYTGYDGGVSCLAHEFAGTMGLSATPKGFATVSGPTGFWDTSDLIVGHGEIADGSPHPANPIYGQLKILDGGVVDSTDVEIGLLPDAVGEVIVDGAGSVWDIAGTLVNGGEGEGSITVTNGGAIQGASWHLVVNSLDSEFVIEEGGEVRDVWQAGVGPGSLIVDGPDSSLTVLEKMNIDGDGLLAVSDNATVVANKLSVHSDSSGATITGGASIEVHHTGLYQSGIFGSLTIEGPGSHLSFQSPTQGISVAGPVSVTGGAFVDGTLSASLEGYDAQVSVTGAGSFIRGFYGDDDNCTLAVADGGSILGNDLKMYRGAATLGPDATVEIGAMKRFNGSTTVTGPESTLTASEDVMIGYMGVFSVEQGAAAAINGPTSIDTGSVHVSGGSLTITAPVNVEDTGTLVVDGADSSCQIGSSLGIVDDGVVEATSGGTIECDQIEATLGGDGASVMATDGGSIVSAILEATHSDVIADGADASLEIGQLTLLYGSSLVLRNGGGASCEDLEFVDTDEDNVEFLMELSSTDDPFLQVTGTAHLPTGFGCDIGVSLTVELDPELELLPGDQFTIIDASAGVTGRFCNYDEGDPVASKDGLELFITYAGGDGNDIAIIAEGGCPADVNGDGTLDVLDFVAFQQLWQAQDPSADCDDNAAFDVLDFVCFQQLFVAGCP